MDGSTDRFAGLVVAGGRSRRMGQDKALLRLGGASLLERAAAGLGSSCVQVGVSVRGPGAVARHAGDLRLSAVEDPSGLAEGPLVGVLAGLSWARRIGAQGLIVVPCDAPFLPDDLPAQLIQALKAAPCAMARTPDGAQPLCSGWRLSMTEMLFDALGVDRHPPVQDVLRAAGCSEIAYTATDAFLNINSRADLATAEGLLATRPSRA